MAFSDQTAKREHNKHELSLGEQALQAQLSLLAVAERSDKPAVQIAAIAMAKKVSTPHSSRIGTPVATILGLLMIVGAGFVIDHAVKSYSWFPAMVVTTSAFGLLLIAIGLLALFSGHIPADKFMKFAAWGKGYFSTVASAWRQWRSGEIDYGNEEDQA